MDLNLNEELESNSEKKTQAIVYASFPFLI